MEKLLKFLRKFLGFSESGRSTLGKLARNIFLKHRVRQGLSVVIIGLLTTTFIVHNFSNIGGPITLNLTSQQGPRVLIDAQTEVSVQVPIEYDYESRGFSWFHSGADLVAPIGTPVRPIMNGFVEAIPSDSFGYGKHVIIAHAEGIKSIYGHLDEIKVSVGEKVNLDTVLGKSGSTGFSTGPHLHLELQENGVVFNPAEIVPGIE